MSAEARDAAPNAGASDVELPLGLPALDAIPSPAAPTDAPPAPPRKSRSGTSGAERRRREKAAGGVTPRRDRPPAAPKVAPLEKRLSEAIGTLGVLVGTFVDPYDGAVLTHNADKAGKVLSGVAARRPGVARLLENMLAVGDNVDGVALLAGMLLPILCHHGIVPAKYAVVATLMGTAPPAGAVDADAAALRDLFAAAGPEATAAA